MVKWMQGKLRIGSGCTKKHRIGTTKSGCKVSLELEVDVPKSIELERLKADAIKSLDLAKKWMQ